MTTKCINFNDVYYYIGYDYVKRVHLFKYHGKIHFGIPDKLRGFLHSSLHRPFDQLITLFGDLKKGRFLVAYNINGLTFFNIYTLQSYLKLKLKKKES